MPIIASAYDGINGYIVFGAPPAKVSHKCEGTIGPSAIAGSIIFCPEKSIEALNKLITIEPDVLAEYGLKDSFNIDPYFIAKTYLGIDKGITIIMLDNYLEKTIHKLMLKHPLVQKAIKKLGFKVV